MNCENCIHDCEPHMECDCCGEHIGEGCKYDSPVEWFDIVCFNCRMMLAEEKEDEFCDDVDCNYDDEADDE